MQPVKAPQRPPINQGRLIDHSPDVDTYILEENVRLHCPKCGKHRYHDIYGTVEGQAVITIKVIIHCRDCGFERAKDPEPIGKVE